VLASFHSQTKRKMELLVIVSCHFEVRVFIIVSVVITLPIFIFIGGGVHVQINARQPFPFLLCCVLGVRRRRHLRCGAVGRRAVWTQPVAFRNLLESNTRLKHTPRQGETVLHPEWAHVQHTHQVERPVAAAGLSVTTKKVVPFDNLALSALGASLRATDTIKITLGERVQTRTSHVVRLGTAFTAQQVASQTAAAANRLPLVLCRGNNLVLAHLRA